MDSNFDQEQLLEDLRKGGRAKEKAIATLYERLFPKLMAHLIFQSCPRHKAEDLVQECFIKVLRNLESFRGESSLTTWIRSILDNTWRDHLRSAFESKRADMELAELEQIEDERNPLASKNLESAEITECVRGGFRIYREKYPECAGWLYKLIDGASIAELAEAANRTSGAMREYLSQCRKKLAPYIEHCRTLVQA